MVADHTGDILLYNSIHGYDVAQHAYICSLVVEWPVVRGSFLVLMVHYCRQWPCC